MNLSLDCSVNSTAPECFINGVSPISSEGLIITLYLVLAFFLGLFLYSVTHKLWRKLIKWFIKQFRTE